MKQWGYGAGYQHAHKLEDALPDMECLPESLVGTRFYEPTNRGLEQRIAERLGRDPRPQDGSPIQSTGQVTLSNPLQGTTTFKREYHPKLGRIRYRSTRPHIAI